MDSLIGVHLRSSAVPPFRFPPANGCFRFSLERPLDRAGGDGMLRLVVTCESDAGYGRRRAFICFFCSGHFARPRGCGKVSCLRLPLISLAPSAAGRACVPKSR